MAINYKIAIVRPDGNITSSKFYNSQEIGLARGLALRGISVDVYVAGASNVINTTEINAEGSGSVRMIEMPFFKLPEIDHAIYPMLTAQLKRNHYDLIQVNEENELTSYWVARFAKSNDIPVVVYQGMYRPLTGRIRAAFQSFYDKVLLPSFRKNINLAIAKTTRAQAHLLKKGFKKTLVIPVGLDTEPFNNSEHKHWRQEYKVPTDNKILLYVGIFERRRNIHFLLDIAKNLRHRPITMLLAGDGNITSEINARINTESISNVRLLGKVPQKYLPSLYEEASIFLLASNYEIYGMVVLEAMYFGTPTFSTRTAGPEDIITSGTDGMLFSSMNVDVWCKEIMKVLFVEKNIDEMRLAAKDKVKHTLTWRAIAEKYTSEVIEVCTKASN